MLKSVLITLALTLPAAAQHATGKVHTPQVDLAYETFGTPSATALPVMAINGGPGLSHKYMMQNDLWSRVGRTHFTVLYDQRGTGLSRPLAAGAPQTMDAQVADLDAVRTALKLPKVVLVGDSYGGLLSIAYAAAHPEHVAKLVLSDSPGPSWKSIVHLLPQVFPDIEESSAAEEKTLGPDTEAAAQAGLLAHFKMIFYSPDKLTAYLKSIGPDLGYVPAVGQAVGDSTSALDLSTQITHFTFPTLILTGRYDMNVAPLTAWHLKQQIPGSTLVFFEQSGHLPAYEEPEKYLQVLLDFLRK